METDQMVPRNLRMHLVFFVIMMLLLTLTLFKKVSAHASPYEGSSFSSTNIEKRAFNMTPRKKQKLLLAIATFFLTFLLMPGVSCEARPNKEIKEITSGKIQGKSAELNSVMKEKMIQDCHYILVFYAWFPTGGSFMGSSHYKFNRKENRRQKILPGYKNLVTSMWKMVNILFS